MSSSDTYFVRPTIPARYLAELLARTGLDRARTLAAAGLPANATVLRKFRASVEQFERLYAVACKACDDEMFGRFANRVPRGTYAVGIRMSTGSRDLAEFIESATRFYALFDRGHRYWHVSRDRGRAVLRVTCRNAQQASSLFFVHSMLLSPWRSAEWLAGERIPLRAVRIDPRFGELATETAFLFGCEPELVPGAAEIHFDASWLATRVVRTPEDAELHVRTSLRTMLAAPAGDTLEVNIRGALAADPHADLSSVARSLHVSRATLARRLAARGLAFQRIKDDVRRDHAIALLGSRLPIADVAERLGFSEPSAFARAFKSWTGVPPGRYHARLRHHPPRSHVHGARSS